MPPFKDITNKRFGRLIAKSVAHKREGSYYWNCECDCGGTSIVKGAHLSNGNTTSCGCHKASVLPIACTKHGQGREGARTGAYVSWKAANTRCSNPNIDDYKDYGGRGIKVCERWRRFENFYADMGDRPAGRSLDRIDVNGNYEPGNCRWATTKEQANNTRRNKVITFEGRSKNITQWATELGVSRKTLTGRLKKLGIERALTELSHVLKKAA